MVTQRSAATAAGKPVQDDDSVIVQDPHDPGRHNARFADHGHHVWAIILHLQGADWDVAAVAKSFNMPVEVVEAAIRYYERNRNLIDAKLLLLREEDSA